MPIDKWFWDQPSAYRFLSGLLETAVKYPADSTVMEATSSSLNVFLNCRPDSIRQVVANTPVSAH